MNMTEVARLLIGLRAAGWTDTEINGTRRRDFSEWAAKRARPQGKCRNDPLDAKRGSTRSRYSWVRLFDFQPRDLRGPGPRAYFCSAAKVGKNALKPCGLRIPHFLFVLRPRHSPVFLPRCRPLRSASASLSEWLSALPTVSARQTPRGAKRYSASSISDTPRRNPSRKLA